MANNNSVHPVMQHLLQGLGPKEKMMLVYAASDAKGARPNPPSPDQIDLSSIQSKDLNRQTLAPGAVPSYFAAEDEAANAVKLGSAFGQAPPKMKVKSK